MCFLVVRLGLGRLVRLFGGLAVGSLLLFAYLHRLGIVASAAADLDAVDHFHHAIDDHAPADDVEGSRGDDAGLDKGDEAGEENECGDNPPEQADLDDAGGGAEVEELVERTEDEDESQSVDQEVDEQRGGEGQQASQQQAAQSDDGEGGPCGRDVASRGIENLYAVDALAVPAGQIGDARHEAGEKEDDADEDGEPQHGVVAILDQEDTDDDGSD